MLSYCIIEKFSQKILGSNFPNILFVPHLIIQYPCLLLCERVDGVVYLNFVVVTARRRGRRKKILDKMSICSPPYLMVVLYDDINIRTAKTSPFLCF